MDSELLVEQKEEGRRLLEQLSRDGLPVSVAFWSRRSSDASWNLSIALSNLDESGLSEGYRKLIASLDKIPNCSLDLIDIKLVSNSSPAVLAAIQIRDRYPRACGFEYDGPRLGELSIYGAYIYPAIESYRISFLVTYALTTEGFWTASLQVRSLSKGVSFSGAMSYSNSGANWTENAEALPNHASVGVMVAIDPKFDAESVFSDPELEKMVKDQAREMADAMFRSHHPDAVIKSEQTPVAC